MILADFLSEHGIVTYCTGGSDKFGGEGKFVDMTVDDIDYIISDRDLPDELKATYKNTTFIYANH